MRPGERWKPPDILRARLRLTVALCVSWRVRGRPFNADDGAAGQALTRARALLNNYQVLTLPTIILIAEKET